MENVRNWMPFVNATAVVLTLAMAYVLLVPLSVASTTSAGLEGRFRAVELIEPVVTEGGLYGRFTSIIPAPVGTGIGGNPSARLN